MREWKCFNQVFFNKRAILSAAKLHVHRSAMSKALVAKDEQNFKENLQNRPDKGIL